MAQAGHAQGTGRTDESSRPLLFQQHVPNEIEKSGFERESKATLESAHLPEIQAMVRLAGIEPTTLGFGGQYSIH
jgi:hypothetical protein